MRRALPLLLSLLGLSLPVVGGCAGSDVDPSEVDGIGEASSEVLAVVALTWRAVHPDDGGEARTAAIGLAQVYVIDHVPGRRAAALELLSVPGAALVLDTSLGVGECKVDGPRGDAGPMLLRDAGEIAVEGDLGVDVLDSSWLPEGSLDISGIAYSGFLAPRGRSAEDGRRPLEVVADGSAEVGPFSVQLTPPPPVKLLAVAGHVVARGRVRLQDGELAQHVDIAWEPAVAPAPNDGMAPASSDLTVVVFERRTFGATWTVSCVVEDDGAFAIPAGALLALPDLGADRTDSVRVRRISSASFSARHVPEGMALAVSEDQAYVE